MTKKGLVSGLLSYAGWLPAALVFLAAALCAPAAGGQASPDAVNPVTKGLSRIEEIVPSDSGDFSFAVFGDNRGSTTVIEHILSRISDDPDILFAVSTGDIVGRGTPELFDFFFAQVARYLTKPLVFVVGNHELAGGGIELYESVVGPRNYSFVFGDAYFIVLDDTNGNRIDAVFEQWLTKELDVAGTYDQTLVFMHVPLYDPPGTGIRHSLGPRTAKQLMDIFKGRRITHIFCSHIHGYYRGNWEGIPYTISGGAGAPLIGTDPAHYFYHYLKVRVRGGAVTVETVPVAPGDK